MSTLDSTTPRPVTTLRQSARVAWHWARAFSTLRTRRALIAWLQWFSYPANWWMGMFVIGMHGTAVQQLEVPYTDQRGRRRRALAGVVAPNPLTRPPRRSWPAVAAAIGAALFWLIVPVLVAVPGVPPGWSYVLVALVVLVAGAFVADRVPALRIHHGAGSPRTTKATLAQMHPQAAPIQVLSMLGAWPMDKHAGWPLFDAVLQEYDQAGVSMMLVARDGELAQKYVARGGTIADDQHPLHIAWLKL